MSEQDNGRDTAEIYVPGSGTHAEEANQELTGDWTGTADVLDTADHLEDSIEIPGAGDHIVDQLEDSAEQQTEDLPSGNQDYGNESHLSEELTQSQQEIMRQAEMRQQARSIMSKGNSNERKTRMTYETRSQENLGSRLSVQDLNIEDQEAPESPSRRFNSEYGVEEHEIEEVTRPESPAMYPWLKGGISGPALMAKYDNKFNLAQQQRLKAKKQAKPGSQRRQSLEQSETESLTQSFKARRETRRKLTQAGSFKESVRDSILMKLRQKIDNFEDDKHKVPLCDIQAIFDKYPKDRTREDFMKVEDFFYKNQFFRTLKEQLGQEAALMCFKQFKIEKFQKGQVVYRYGGTSDCCYFIMKGSVDIKIPFQEEMVFGSNRELLSFLQANFKDIIWDKIPNGETLKKKTLKFIEVMQDSQKSLDDTEVTGTLRTNTVADEQAAKTISDNEASQSPFKQQYTGILMKTQQTASLDKSLNNGSEHNMRTLDQGSDGSFRINMQATHSNILVHQMISYFKTIKVCGPSDNFGELALVKSGGVRSATVTCLEDDCQFFTLDAELYSRIVDKTIKRDISDRVGFLKTFRIFRHMRNPQLEKLLYFIEQMVVKRGKVMYKVGQKPDGVYLIQDGEFELSKPANLALQTELNAYEHRNDPVANVRIKKQTRVQQDNSLQHIKISNLGKGEIFGLEECQIRPGFGKEIPEREFTVTCSRNDSKVLFISHQVFSDRVLSDQNTETDIKMENAIKQYFHLSRAWQQHKTIWTGHTHSPRKETIEEEPSKEDKPPKLRSVENYIREKFETEYYSLVVNNLQERAVLNMAQGQQDQIKKANKKIQRHWDKGIMFEGPSKDTVHSRSNSPKRAEKQKQTSIIDTTQPSFSLGFQSSYMSQNPQGISPTMQSSQARQQPVKAVHHTDLSASKMSNVQKHKLSQFNSQTLYESSISNSAKIINTNVASSIGDKVQSVQAAEPVRDNKTDPQTKLLAESQNTQSQPQMAAMNVKEQEHFSDNPRASQDSSPLPMVKKELMNKTQEVIQGKIEGEVPERDNMTEEQVQQTKKQSMMTAIPEDVPTNQDQQDLKKDNSESDPMGPSALGNMSNLRDPRYSPPGKNFRNQKKPSMPLVVTQSDKMSYSEVRNLQNTPQADTARLPKIKTKQSRNPNRGESATTALLKEDSSQIPNTAALPATTKEDDIYDQVRESDNNYPQQESYLQRLTDQSQTHRSPISQQQEAYPTSSDNQGVSLTQRQKTTEGKAPTISMEEMQMFVASHNDSLKSQGSTSTAQQADPITASTSLLQGTLYPKLPLGTASFQTQQTMLDTQFVPSAINPRLAKSTHRHKKRGTSQSFDSGRRKGRNTRNHTLQQSLAGSARRQQQYLSPNHQHQEIGTMADLPRMTASGAASIDDPFLQDEPPQPFLSPQAAAAATELIQNFMKNSGSPTTAQEFMAIQAKYKLTPEESYQLMIQQYQFQQLMSQPTTAATVVKVSHQNYKSHVQQKREEVIQFRNHLMQRFSNLRAKRMAELEKQRKEAAELKAAKKKEKEKRKRSQPSMAARLQKV